jgi:hypothetical protein
VARHFLYRFQYRKKLWGNLKKDRRKKNVFVEKYDEITSFDGSDLDSDETFQILRNVGLEIDEIVCLLDSQLIVIL